VVLAKVDLSKGFKPSSSGKTIITVSTGYSYEAAMLFRNKPPSYSEGLRYLPARSEATLGFSYFPLLFCAFKSVK
jgi:hypothetical protein